MAWTTALQLLAGVGLSLLIGAERSYRGKSAGLRTCALVGLGATLFTVVSREGAWLLPGLTVTNVDGSRVAAQIVSGIGFLGAGLIFVRRDAVQGLTTAACIWFVAAVGMACGADVIGIAALATGLYLIVVTVAPQLQKILPRSRSHHAEIVITYEDGHGVLRDIMGAIGDLGASVDGLFALRIPSPRAGLRLQRVVIEVQTRTQTIGEIIGSLTEIERVHEVHRRSSDDD